ncbi:MAG: trigger factor, partial [Humibacter sp.]
SNYLVQAAAQYGMDPNEFVQLLGENGQLPQMFGEVARNKTIAVLLGRAVVKDSNGQPVDLSEFAAVNEPAEDAETSDDADASGAESSEDATEAADEAAPEAEEKPKKKSGKAAKA